MALSLSFHFMDAHFVFFFLLFLFLLQVLKCHPPVLGSYSEHVCRGRGQMEAGEEEDYE